MGSQAEDTGSEGFVILRCSRIPAKARRPSGPEGAVSGRNRTENREILMIAAGADGKAAA